MKKSDLTKQDACRVLGIPYPKNTVDVKIYEFTRKETVFQGIPKESASSVIETLLKRRELEGRRPRTEVM